jgi:bacterioferritin-associated ferredoxin
VIVCICRGVSDKTIEAKIHAGATTVRDLQRCGIADQCGSCHNVLRTMLAQASAAAATPPCPMHAPEPAAAMA